MPELPELETILVNIREKLIGKKILYVHTRCDKLRWPISQEIKNLNNVFIINIQRRAKYLIFKFLKGYILLHLGMSGHLKLISNDIEKKIVNKHDHIDIIIDNGIILRYTDPRRFGCCLWLYSLNHKLLNKLGPEPLSNNLNAGYLFKKSRKIKKIIKPWLMQNDIVVGIGNIYSNEILFESKIFPNRSVNSLKYEEYVKLSLNIKKILLFAIKNRGATIKDFINIDGSYGNFQKYFKVYNRKGKKCFSCSSTIEIMFHNKRKTFFCRKCQK